MIPTFACVLRSGGDYNASHFLCLRRQVYENTTLEHNFVCLSDTGFPGTIPLERNYPGWWSCVELWKLKGPTIVTGLDTLVTGNIDDLFHLACSLGPNDFYLLNSPFHKGQFVNGIQMWNGDWSWLLDGFDYEEMSRLFRGDENYLIDKLEKHGANIQGIQDFFPWIYNYLREYRNNRAQDHRIIYFHGRPRPWNVGNLWRKYSYWRKG